MLVGYMRVSSDSARQTTDLQRDALLSAGVDSRHLTNLAAGDTSVGSTPTPYEKSVDSRLRGNAVGGIPADAVRTIGARGHRPSRPSMPLLYHHSESNAGCAKWSSGSSKAQPGRTKATRREIVLTGRSRRLEPSGPESLPERRTGAEEHRGLL